MPVRSLNSSVFKWPDSELVRRAVLSWASSTAQSRPEVLAIGYFGSYARGDWGVGSDLDLVAVVESSNLEFPYRSNDWDMSGLPVPADIIVYTRDEWFSLMDGGTRFGMTLLRETRWVFIHPLTFPDFPKSVDFK
jgi:uncharacterized protein